MIERLWRNVEVADNGCWIYTGYLDREGYGRIAMNAWETGGKAIYRGTHAWVWESINGPIPSGLEPDHLCREKTCCNPDHLEIVTHQVNAQRRSAQITHCPQDHPYDEANTYVDPTGRRHCRTCSYQAKKRHRARVGRTVAG